VAENALVGSDRLALGLEYYGAAYSGWQVQPNANTVQAKLESALAAIANQPMSTICAGRTDAGVHAICQVVHFDSPVERPINAWVRGVNAHLPASVAVRWAIPVASDFHARYSALSRRYCYVLLNRASRPGLLAGRVGWAHLPLSLKPMQKAAEHLLGEHDFSAFRAAECQAKTSRRHVLQARVSQQEDCYYFEFVADAFLQHMVRNMVGSLLWVGQGKKPARWITELLQQGERSLAAPTSPPDGLYFVAPEYPPAHPLPLERYGNSPQFGIFAT